MNFNYLSQMRLHLLHLLQLIVELNLAFLVVFNLFIKNFMSLKIDLNFNANSYKFDSKKIDQYFDYFIHNYFIIKSVDYNFLIENYQLKLFHHSLYFFLVKIMNLCLFLKFQFSYYLKFNLVFVKMIKIIIVMMAMMLLLIKSIMEHKDDFM